MTIAPDMLSEFGGVPVGSRQTFEGWWGATTFFVDYTDGSAGALGDSMTAPTKHLRVALANASAGDTIYVRPRGYNSAATYAEDPLVITPDTAANWAVSRLKSDLSIIGTGKGLGSAGAHKCWIGGYSALTTPVIYVQAPGVVLENLRAAVGTSTDGIFQCRNDATYDGGNFTVQNCDFHDATGKGGIWLESCWEVAIVGNRFINCDVGVYSYAAYSKPGIWQFWNNLFTVETGEVKADVFVASGVIRFHAYNNYHAAAQPTLGSPNKYYSFNAASTGAIQNCYFGVEDTAAVNLFTLNGVLQSGNHSSIGLVITT